MQERAKKTPGVGAYKTTESHKVLAPMPLAMRRRR